MSDQQRYGRIGAYESWSRTVDRTARTMPGRRAALDRFEKQVDPHGVLPPAERAKRADAAKQAHMLRMAQASVSARRLRKRIAAEKAAKGRRRGVSTTDTTDGGAA